MDLDIYLHIYVTSHKKKNGQIIFPFVPYGIVVCPQLPRHPSVRHICIIRNKLGDRISSHQKCHLKLWNFFQEGILRLCYVHTNTSLTVTSLSLCTYISKARQGSQRKRSQPRKLGNLHYPARRRVTLCDPGRVTFNLLTLTRCFPKK